MPNTLLVQIRGGPSQSCDGVVDQPPLLVSLAFIPTITEG